MAGTAAGTVAVVALAVLLTGGGSNIGTLVGLGPEPTPTPTSTTLAASGSPTGTVVLGDAVPGAASPTAVPTSALPTLESGAGDPTQLGSVLAPLLAAQGLGSSVSIDVVDATNGTSLLTRDASALRTPASTVKLWTAAAALGALGAQSTLPTTAVSSGNAVVLEAGGDVLLGSGASDPAEVDGHAGLQDLADQVAWSLKQQGRTSVSVQVDDTLFTGARTSPGWGSGDVAAGFVAPITPLMVDAGRVGKGHYARRASDPSLTAGQGFAAALREAGVTVTGPVTRGTAAADADELGRVESAPLGDVVEYMLTESDNTVAEALGRLVAVKKGQPATFDGASAAVIGEVAALGVPTDGATLQGTSGLGRGTAVPAESLTKILVLAAAKDQPQLRPILTGLPISRLTGTLEDRFEKRSQAVTAGVVRAKTGSLTGVSSLAGTVVDADGRMIAFAVLADHTGATDPARKALDAIATAITQCGCR